MFCWQVGGQPALPIPVVCGRTDENIRLRGVSFFKFDRSEIPQGLVNTDPVVGQDVFRYGVPGLPSGS